MLRLEPLREEVDDARETVWLDVVRAHQEGQVHVELVGHAVTLEQRAAVLEPLQVGGVLLRSDVAIDAGCGVLESSAACKAVQLTTLGWNDPLVVKVDHFFPLKTPKIRPKTPQNFKKEGIPVFQEFLCFRHIKAVRHGRRGS